MNKRTLLKLGFHIAAATLLYPLAAFGNKKPSKLSANRGSYGYGYGNYGYGYGYGYGGYGYGYGYGWKNLWRRKVDPADYEDVYKKDEFPVSP